jgi:hypothetical protein
MERVIKYHENSFIFKIQVISGPFEIACALKQKRGM